MPIRYMIVDDEPIAHRIIEDYAGTMTNFELVNNSYNALAALNYLQNNQVDLIFLDINMPKLNGFEFLRTLTQPPSVIITSAHQEYALTGYEFNVCDYLLKPFALTRFMMAVNKVTAPIAVNSQQIQNEKIIQLKPEAIFVKGDKKQHQIFLKDIHYIEALGNYCIVYFDHDKLIAQQSISGFETLLCNEQFIRSHKSFIVAKAKVRAIDSNHLLLEKRSIPIGQTYKKILNDWLRADLQTS